MGPLRLSLLWVLILLGGFDYTSQRDSVPSGIWFSGVAHAVLPPNYTCPDDLTDIDGPAELICDCAREADADLINWAEFYFCNENGGELFFMVLVTLFFFRLLASTTDQYMVPSLEGMSEVMRLSPNVAGVTLLAFGNGAPDVFSSFSSFTNGSGEIGVGSAIGAGMFLYTVVLGSVIWATPGGEGFHTSRRPFLRDGFFYLVGVAFLFIIFQDSKVTVTEAILFLGWYVCFSVTVVVGRVVYQRIKARRLRNAANDAQAEAAGSDESAGLSATAAVLQTVTKSDLEVPLMSDAEEEAQPSQPSQPPRASSQPTGRGALQESMSLRDVRRRKMKSKPSDPGAGGSGSGSRGGSARSLLSVPPNSLALERAAGEDWLSSYYRVRSVTKTHASMTAPQLFTPKTHTQGGQLVAGRQTMASLAGFGTSITSEQFYSDWDPELNKQKSAHLQRRAQRHALSTGQAAADEHEPDGGADSAEELKAAPPATVSDSRWGVYKQRARIVLEKVLLFIEAPFVLARALTIPSLKEDDEEEEEEEQDSDQAAGVGKDGAGSAGGGGGGGTAKRGSYAPPSPPMVISVTPATTTESALTKSAEHSTVAASVSALSLAPEQRMQGSTSRKGTDGKPKDEHMLVSVNPLLLSLNVVLSPLTFLWVVGSTSPWGYMVILFLGSFLSVWLFNQLHTWVTTDETKVFGKVVVRLPRGVHFAFLVMGFVMAVVWVYKIADILVDLLGVIGLAVGLSPNIMGLTILAWGNSMPDYVADVSLSKNGQARMAAAGCMGGPCFNMLVGLGMGLTYRTIHDYPENFEFPFHPVVPTTFMFLLGVILMTMLAVPLVYRFYFRRSFAVVLVVFYSVFLFVGILGETGKLDYPDFGYKGNKGD